MIIDNDESKEEVNSIEVSPAEPHSKEAKVEPVDSQTVEQKPAVDEMSPYLVKRLFETNERNLFNHVKFCLVKQEIDKLNLEHPKVLDIGCGLQVAKHYLESLELDFTYYGTDYEPKFKPDSVINLLESHPQVDFAPDIVLMLDVLEHLHEDISELQAIVGRIKNMIPADSAVIITLPQMYRLDRFKLKHLIYPEHKIRLTQQEWRNVIEAHFDIQSVQGLGYLSVIPYLPMASKRYTADNRLGKLFMHLRSHTFEWGPLKPIDLWLSNTLGKLGFMKTLSNDFLFVARPKK